MLSSFIFLCCYPWMYKENQKMISIDIAFYFGHLLKLSRMCLKQDGNFSKESYIEKNRRFILK